MSYAMLCGDHHALLPVPTRALCTHADSPPGAVPGRRDAAAPKHPAAPARTLYATRSCALGIPTVKMNSKSRILMYRGIVKIESRNPVRCKYSSKYLFRPKCPRPGPLRGPPYLPYQSHLRSHGIPARTLFLSVIFIIDYTF